MVLRIHRRWRCSHCLTREEGREVKTNQSNCVESCKAKVSGMQVVNIEVNGGKECIGVRSNKGGPTTCEDWSSRPVFKIAFTFALVLLPSEILLILSALRRLRTPLRKARKWSHLFLVKLYGSMSTWTIACFVESIRRAKDASQVNRLTMYCAKLRELEHKAQNYGERKAIALYNSFANMENLNVERTLRSCQIVRNIRNMESSQHNHRLKKLSGRSLIVISNLLKIIWIASWSNPWNFLQMPISMPLKDKYSEFEGLFYKHDFSRELRRIKVGGKDCVHFCVVWGSNIEQVHRYSMRWRCYCKKSNISTCQIQIMNKVLISWGGCVVTYAPHPKERHGRARERREGG